MEKSFCLKLPLGYSEPMGRAYSNTLAEGLEEVLGKFSRVIFNVGRLGDNVFQITISRTGVPEARGGLMDLNETVTGMAGDSLRLKYGEMITIVSGEPDGLIVRIFPHP